MKKLWSASSSINRNRIHARSSIVRRSAWKRWKREYRISRIAREPDRSPGHRRNPKILLAPPVLSLLEAPDDSVAFFAKMIACDSNRDLFVDLSMVKTITPDAIALLLGVVKYLNQRKKKILVSGNYPESPSATETIRESGFNAYLRTSMPPAAKTCGAIVRQELSFDSKKANGQFARKLIDFAVADQSAESSKANRLRLKISYGHLLDCMGNTHQHAGRVAGEETWWASVFRDSRRGCDCFTFIDMGVGIFNSIDMSTRIRVFNMFHFLRHKILKLLLEGQIPSSTGKSYRGRGLPSMYRSAMEGKVQRLVIVTNDVYADAGRNDFRSLGTTLRGVVLYWEVPHGGRKDS